MWHRCCHGPRMTNNRFRRSDTLAMISWSSFTRRAIRPSRRIASSHASIVRATLARCWIECVGLTESPSGSFSQMCLSSCRKTMSNQATIASAWHVRPVLASLDRTCRIPPRSLASNSAIYCCASVRLRCQLSVRATELADKPGAPVRFVASPRAVINGEWAAYRSPEFDNKFKRTRQQLLESIYNEFNPTA